MKHNIHQFNYQHKMKQTVKLAVALLLACLGTMGCSR